jgi:hypothetical protein
MNNKVGGGNPTSISISISVVLVVLVGREGIQP